MFENLINICNQDCLLSINYIFPNKVYRKKIHYAQLPTIFDDGKNFHCFFSDRSRHKNNSFIRYMILDHKFNEVFYQNKPFYQPNRIGFFDSHGAMPNQVIKLKNQYYLTYNGWNALVDHYLNSVGLIKLNLNRGKFSYEAALENPFLGRNFDNPSSAVVPWVYFYRNQFNVYYIGTDKWKKVNNKYQPLYYIKFAKGSNLYNLKTLNHKLLIDIYDEEVYSRPTIISYKDKLIMAFCSRKIRDFRDGINSYKIQFATANRKNLIWKRKEYLFSPNLDWCNKQTSYPFFLKKNDIFYMFFNGNGFGKSGFGVATFHLERFFKLLSS